MLLVPSNKVKTMPTANSKSSKSGDNHISIRYGLLLVLLYGFIIPLLLASPFLISKLFGFSLANAIGLHSNNFIVLVIFIIAGSALITCAIIILKMKSLGQRWVSLGFRGFVWYKALLYGLGWPFVLLAVLIPVVFISQSLGMTPPGETTKSSVINSGGMLPAIILASVIAPIVEEILFRGILFSSISRKYGATVGVILSSLVFALAHINPLQMITAIILGPYLCLIFMRTKSIYPGMILHSVHNGLVTYIALSS